MVWCGEIGVGGEVWCGVVRGGVVKCSKIRNDVVKCGVL